MPNHFRKCQIYAHTLGGDTSGSLVTGGGRRSGVALRVFTSLIRHLRSVSTSGAGVGILKNKKKTLEQPVTKFTMAILVGRERRGGGKKEER